MYVNIILADIYTYFSKINDGSGIKSKQRDQDGLKNFEFILLLFYINNRQSVRNVFYNVLSFFCIYFYIFI